MVTAQIADRSVQARRFAALGDPTRLEVFHLVSRSPRAVSEIAEHLPVSRPAVSQHLKVLAEAGLVSFDAVGARNIYRPNAEAIASMRTFIDSVWDVGLSRFQAAAEGAAERSSRKKA